MNSDSVPGHEPPVTNRPVRVYGADLDGEPCQARAALAGFEYDSEDPKAPRIPNPDCTHPQGCHCAWL